MPREFEQSQWNAQLAADCRALTRLAALEDLDQGYDWTTMALVPESSRATAQVRSREHGRAAGLAAIPEILSELGADVVWEPYVADGQVVSPQMPLGQLRGSARDLLTTERVILNFVGHLSGIATLTQTFVNAMGATPARIYDTRKTIPGYRRLEKYAVRCGGGHNHRHGLYDAILIKDNHLAFGLTDQREHFDPATAVRVARQFTATMPHEIALKMIVEVEVDSLEQLQAVLPAAPDLVLLDNMTVAQLTQAVAWRNTHAPDIELEASGGVNLSTIAAIAQTGVERISVGALTHSARCLDVGLDWDPSSLG